MYGSKSLSLSFSEESDRNAVGEFLLIFMGLALLVMLNAIKQPLSRSKAQVSYRISPHSPMAAQGAMLNSMNGGQPKMNSATRKRSHRKNRTQSKGAMSLKFSECARIVKRPGG
jgi:hypothetical protein